MRNEPRVWLEDGDAGMSSAGAVLLRSAQMMGQQKNMYIYISSRSKYNASTINYLLVFFLHFDLKLKSFTNFCSFGESFYSNSKFNNLHPWF